MYLGALPDGVIQAMNLRRGTRIVVDGKERTVTDIGWGRNAIVVWLDGERTEYHPDSHLKLAKAP